MGRTAQDACKQKSQWYITSTAVVDRDTSPDVYEEFVQPELRVLVKL